MRRLRRGGRSASPPARRRGPAGEVPWWTEADQARLEALPLSSRSFGRGWLEIDVVSNEERLDPWAAVDGASELQAVRAARALQALDEGRAWRQRTSGALAVLRAESFAGDDPTDHIDLWAEGGAVLLRQQWQTRWRERDIDPGWVEATLRDDPDPTPSPDGEGRVWFGIEDHTDPSGTGTVTCYEHLSLWHRRHHVVLVVRHELGIDLDAECRRAATVLADALADP